MWNDANVALLKDLWSRGYSASDIAGKLEGCSRSAVCAKLQRLGLKRAHKPPTSKPVILSVRRRAVEAVPRAPTARKSFERVNYTKRELQEMLAKAVKNTL
jgi:GcrA cell cycle regulator